MLLSYVKRQNGSDITKHKYLWTGGGTGDVINTSKLNGVKGVVLTKGNKGFGRFAGLGHTNCINGKNPHLIRHTLDHLLRLKCGLFAEVKVKTHPSGALLLLPLNEVS